MNQKIKVLIVTPDFYPNNLGGCGLSAYLLWKELMERKIAVDVISFDTQQETIIKGSSTVFRIKGFPKFGLLNILLAGIKLRNKLSNYDVIHVFNMDMIPPVVLNSFKKNRIVATINNPKGAMITRNAITFQFFAQYLHDLIIMQLIKLSSLRVNKFIALTEAISELYVNAGYNSESIRVIPNMYDKLFSNKNMKSIRRTGKKFLYVGQLSEKKGLKTLLKAFTEFIYNNPTTNDTLTICGKGKLSDWISTHISKHEQESRIILTDSQYIKLPNLYQDHDVLVHPAEWFEPFSRTWLEAMQQQLIIISTNNPSAIEVLPQNTFFFSTQKELSKTIKHVSKMRKFDIDYSKTLTMYSPKRVVNRILETYI